MFHKIPLLTFILKKIVVSSILISLAFVSFSFYFGPTISVEASQNLVKTVLSPRALAPIERELVLPDIVYKTTETKNKNDVLELKLIGKLQFIKQESTGEIIMTDGSRVFVVFKIVNNLAIQNLIRYSWYDIYGEVNPSPDFPEVYEIKSATVKIQI